MATRERKMPAKVVAMRAKKRQKLNGGAPKAARKKQASRRVAMDLNQLDWKPMQMPGRLDDWEGLNGGIEEISDVEVSRDEKTGKRTFTVMAATDGGEVRRQGSDDGDDHDVEEWGGFSDDDIRDERPRKAQKGGLTAPSAMPVHPPVETTNGDLSGLIKDDSPDGVDTSAWQSLKLSPDTRAALSKLRFGSPTAIQKAAIPKILAGEDVIGKASTGSGKTLAFGIPILEQFLEERFTGLRDSAKKLPLALILSPTRELAHQLDKHLSALCSSVVGGGPSIATLTGGLSLQKQQRLLKNADIVIGTPGRIWEVIGLSQSTSKALRQIRSLVVDEADRLLSEGHFQEMEEILRSLDQKDYEETEVADDEQQMTRSGERQTLVFSATFDRGLQKRLASRSRPGGDLASKKDSLAFLLSKLNFRSEQPEFIDVNPVNQLATGLTEELVQCEGTEKDLYLYTLLFDRSKHRTLVFVNSIDAVRRLVPMLQNLNINALALHSEMPQKARLRSVERFTQSKVGEGCVLIATDVAARGLDIPHVQTVIHYHLPRAADTYVHRSGRTARAGQQGSSIIICSAKEASGVRRLVASVHAQAAIHADAGDAAKNGYYIRTLDPERRTVTQLNPRLKLAKKIADCALSKQKQGKADSSMRAAAEELGQEYDSEEFEAQASLGRQGRGNGRHKRERQAAGTSKAELGAMRAELKEMLGQRINGGYSPKYITGGGVDIQQLLREQGLE